MLNFTACCVPLENTQVFGLVSICFDWLFSLVLGSFWLGMQRGWSHHDWRCTYPGNATVFSWYFLVFSKNKICCVAGFPPQDARDDVGGAQNAGMLGILVRTGKKLVYKWRHLSREPSHFFVISIAHVQFHLDSLKTGCGQRHNEPKHSSLPLSIERMRMRATSEKKIPFNC